MLAILRAISALTEKFRPQNNFVEYHTAEGNRSETTVTKYLILSNIVTMVLCAVH